MECFFDHLVWKRTCNELRSLAHTDFSEGIPMQACSIADLGLTLTEVFHGSFEQRLHVHDERGSHKSDPRRNNKVFHSRGDFD